MSSDDLAKRYRAIPTGVLSDVMVKAGQPHQAISARVAAFDGLGPFAGPAFCVRGERKGQGEPRVDRRFELYRQFPSGSVLVIATDGFTPNAVLGENMTSALKMRGCAAIVTDGGYRDRKGIADMAVPVRAAFLTPVASAGTFTFTGLDVAVSLPGQTAEAITIETGDMIVADDDGIVVVPKRGLQTIVEDAEKVIEAEEKTRQLILDGEDAERAYAANDRFSHIRKI